MRRSIRLTRRSVASRRPSMSGAVSLPSASRTGPHAPAPAGGSSRAAPSSGPSPATAFTSTSASAPTSAGDTPAGTHELPARSQFDDQAEWGGFTTQSGAPVTWHGLVSDTVANVVAIDARIAALAAERYELLAHARDQAVELAHLHDGEQPLGARTVMALKELSCELGLATRRHDRAVQADLETAAALVKSLPNVVAALEEGRMGASHAEACLSGLLHLDTAEQISDYDREMSRVAQSCVPGRIRREGRALASNLAALTVRERCRRAIEERRVWITDEDDGMSTLHVLGPTPLVHSLHDRLGAMAREQMQHDLAAQAQGAAGTSRSDTSPDVAPVDEPSPTLSDWMNDTYGLPTDDRRDGIESADEPPGEQSSGREPQCHASQGRASQGQGRPAGDPPPRSFAHHVCDLAIELLLLADPFELARREVRVPAHVTLTIPALALATSKACRGTTTTQPPTKTARPNAEGARPETEATRTRGEHAADGGADGVRMQDEQSHAFLDTVVADAIAANTTATATAATGPIDMALARHLAGDAVELVRVLTHPVTGQVVSVDRRDATEPMRRFLRVHDPFCVWPGCNLPARRCQADHIVPWEAGGPTSLDNLQHLCQRHHTMKHRPGFRVERRPNGGTVIRTPSGQLLETEPTLTHLPGSRARTRVRFAPTPTAGVDARPGPDAGAQAGSDSGAARSPHPTTDADADADDAPPF